MKKSEVENIRSQKTSKTRGRRRAQQMAPEGSPTVTGAFRHLSKKLFVMRESAEYAFMLLEKMIEQTLLPHAGRSSVDTALRIGITPMLRTAAGEAIRKQYNMRVIFSTEGRRRELGVLYRIDEDWFLLILAGAGQKSLDGDNEFTRVLLETLSEVRPEELITGPFSRLCRTSANASLIREQVRSGRTLVRTVESIAGMDLNTPVGDMGWDLLVRGAEFDYNSTLSRLLTGVIFELKNNRYPKSEISLPYGYHKVTVEGKPSHVVKPDLSQDHVVKAIIELATSDLTLRDVADELAKLGLRSRHPGQVASGNPPAVNKVKHPDTLVKGLFAALPTYLDGKYRFTHEMTIPNTDQMHGLAVHRTAPEDPGYIQVDLDFGLPDGGWHETEVIEEAIEKRLSTPDSYPMPRRNKNVVKPLASIFRWDDEAHENFLHSDSERYYTLRRRPLTEAFDLETGKRKGFGSYDGELIGRFEALVIHHAIADGLARLAEGLPCDQTCPQASPVSDDRLSALRELRDAAEAAASNARSELIETTNEASKIHLRTLAEEKQQEADRHQSAIAELERPVTQGRHLVDASEIAAVIAILRTTDDGADISLNRALRRLLRDPQIRAEARHPLATITFSIEIRSSEGSVRVGPLEALTTNGAVGVGPKHPEWKQSFTQRNRSIVKILLLEESRIEERQALIFGEGLDSRGYVRRMASALEDIVPTKQALSALIDSPILDLRRAVIGRMMGLDLAHNLPPDLAEQAFNIYNDPQFWWSHGWSPGGMTRRRMVLAFIDKYATDPDEGLAFNVIRDRVGIDDATLYGYLRNKSDRPAYHNNKTPVYRIAEDVDGWLQSGKRLKGKLRSIRVLECQFCKKRKLIQPLKVPEVPGHLLCVNCFRDQTEGWLYPPAYFQPWDGPQTLARRNGAIAQGGGRYERSRAGRMIVGTDLYKLEIPSLHTPRKIDT